MSAKGQLIVRIIRGSHIESVHLGHVVISNAQGTMLAHCGNSQYQTYARSTVKPIQAIAIIESGAKEQYQLTDAEIAVICSSHHNESIHIDHILSILHKIGLTKEDLYCDIHDNCSGKHVGMLMLSRLMNCSSNRYEQLDHPVQARIMATLSQFCDIESQQLITAIDGCGVPVFGMPLHKLALGFARLGTPPDKFQTSRKSACHTIIHSLQTSPILLAGKHRFDTELIQITEGTIIGKMGAEGIYTFTVPNANIGAAIKINDGAERALYPAVVEVLHQIKLIDHTELMKLRPYHKPQIRNRRGEIVGSIQPECQLNIENEYYPI